LLAGLTILMRTPGAAATGGGATAKWRGARTVLRNRLLVAALALAALAQCGIASYYTFFPVYLEGLGATRPQIGLAYTLQGVSELPVFFLSGLLLRRLGVRVTLAAALAILAARMFCYSLLDRPLIAISLGLTHGLSFSLLLVSFISHINDLTPVEWRATGQTMFWAAFWGVGGIAGNAWAGAFFDRVGPHAVFRFDAIILTAAAAGAWLIIPRRPAG
jgi:predicted MFS family arabinose efflux permease